MKGLGLGENAFLRCYIAYYGPAAGVGANHGKAIAEFTMDHKTGLIQAGPETLIQYQGEKKTTVLGVAEGPDGLYFTDFFGETTGVDAEGAGTVWKVVLSDATSNLPTVDEQKMAELQPAARGEIYFRKNCSTCHRLDGWGGHEGPELSLAHKKLPERLNSKGYVSSVQTMIDKDMGALEPEQWRLQEVMDASDGDRYRTWLVHHLEEPRFDNPFAKMPNFKTALSNEIRSDIIAFLVSRN
jgi:cytochrome c2